MFEVKIEIAQADTTLRPGMTTSNAIETASIPNVLSVPLEAVVTEGGYSYVYKKDGRGVVKQMVETGRDERQRDRRARGARGRTIACSSRRPPTGRASRRQTIPGLKPTTAPIAGGDTAKSVKMPAEAAGAAPQPAPTPPAPPAPARQAEELSDDRRAARARRPLPSRAPRARRARRCSAAAPPPRRSCTTSCARASRRSASCSASRR